MTETETMREREKVGDIERERDRQTDRQRQRQTDRDRQRERERDTQRHRERERRVGGRESVKGNGLALSMHIVV